MPDGLQKTQSRKSARLLPSYRPGFSYASQVREEARRLQHSRPEKRATAYGLTGDDEHSVARVVKRFGGLGSRSHMRLDHLEDEEIMLLNERIVEKATFETGVAFGDKRRLDGTSLLGCEAKLSEFVDLRPGRVADPDHNVRESCRGQIDNALTALADHLEGVIAA